MVNYKLDQLIKTINASTEDVLYQRLFDTFKTKNAFTNEIVDTYINALIHKPTNPMPEVVAKENLERTYLFEAPTRLPEYFKQF